MGSPLVGVTKDRSFQALTELQGINISPRTKVPSHLEVQIAKLNGASHGESIQVWEQDKLLHSFQTGWR